MPQGQKPLVAIQFMADCISSLFSACLAGRAAPYARAVGETQTVIRSDSDRQQMAITSFNATPEYFLYALIRGCEKQFK